MDMTSLALKLGLSESSTLVVRKAEELRRLSNLNFHSASSFALGEVCKSVICFELACTSLRVSFDRERAARLSGLSAKAYIRSLTNLQNALGLRPVLDVRELAIQFGCVRLVSNVQKALNLYKQRFVAALPESRRCSADFHRPIFVAVAFYLCARRNKVKVDRKRLIEISASSDSEFSSVATSMSHLCPDMFALDKVPDTGKCRADLSNGLLSKRSFKEVESDSAMESLNSLKGPCLDISKRVNEESFKADLHGNLKKSKRMAMTVTVVEPMPSS